MNKTGWHLSFGGYKCPLMQKGSGAFLLHGLLYRYTGFVYFWSTVSDQKASWLNLIGANDASHYNTSSLSTVNIYDRCAGLAI